MARELSVRNTDTPWPARYWSGAYPSDLAARSPIELAPEYSHLGLTICKIRRHSSLACEGRPLRRVPVEDLLAGPEQRVTMLADMGEDVAEIFEPVRRPHDVGVHHQCHDPRRPIGGPAEAGRSRA